MLLLLSFLCSQTRYSPCFTIIIFSFQHNVRKEPSDSKEARPPKDVWRSATTMSGAQCVMTSGIIMMPEWPADSLDSVALVSERVVL